MEYVSVEEARDAGGLRLVLTAGVPGPWGEAAKAILNYKEVAFTPVLQEGGGENTALREWTGQTSAPVAVLDDEPPVSHWLDLLMFAERIAPEKALLPENMQERAQVLGLSALIAGVDGVGWNCRHYMLAPMMAMEPPPEPIARLAHKYGWSDEALARAATTLTNIASTLDAQLAGQQEQGREYLVGSAVSAADLYWATFSNMVDPLPEELNPMPDYLRSAWSNIDSAVREAFTERLIAHRDLVFERHIALPLDF